MNTSGMGLARPGTITDLVDRCAEQRPDRPLLLDTNGRMLTTSQVASLSRAVAGWLEQRGVLAGMTIAWQLPSHPMAAVIMLALARMPVTQAPVLHLYRRREVQAALEVAQADVLVVDTSCADNAPADIPTVIAPDDLLDGLSTAVGSRREPNDTPAATQWQSQWIYFTSGTTGQPKGVRHSDATLLGVTRGFVDHLGLGSYPNEVGNIAFPIAHVGGMIYLAASLMGDFPTLMIPKIVLGELPRQLAEHRVTVSGASTAFYQMLVASQLAAPTDELLMPTLRMLIGGGAACPPQVHRQVREHLRIPVVHAYGMTEVPMVCVSEVTDTTEQLENSSGRPIPGSAVRVGVHGEIEIRGANLTPGYLETDLWQQALTADGWFRTGDRGRLRADGRIVITGRTKDLIIRKGENISPEEIENELLGHPGVQEVAVLGQPDESRGELVCAVVRLSPGQTEMTLDELCNFLDARGLMKQKWPERLVVVDEFPLTGLGKVSRTALAEMITGGAR